MYTFKTYYPLNQTLTEIFSDRSQIKKFKLINLPISPKGWIILTEQFGMVGDAFLLPLLSCRVDLSAVVSLFNPQFWIFLSLESDNVRPVNWNKHHAIEYADMHSAFLIRQNKVHHNEATFTFSSGHTNYSIVVTSCFRITPICCVFVLAKLLYGSNFWNFYFHSFAQIQNCIVTKQKLFILFCRAQWKVSYGCLFQGPLYHQILLSCCQLKLGRTESRSLCISLIGSKYSNAMMMT